MTFSRNFFTGSLTSELLGLGRKELQFLYARSDQAYRVRLLHFETWAHMCLYGTEKGPLLDRLHAHIAINPH